VSYRYREKLAAIVGIQDVSNHGLDEMAGHYPSEARKFAAANLMTSTALRPTGSGRPSGCQKVGWCYRTRI